LGLTISKEFVNFMGGAMTVKSLVGQGTTFSFNIPLKLAHQTSPVQEIEMDDVPSNQNSFVAYLKEA